MPFLLRVELPDVPGSLGRLASAIGVAALLYMWLNGRALDLSGR